MAVYFFKTTLKLGKVVHTCNPSAQEDDAGRL
jgi:hypothetical protein